MTSAADGARRPARIVFIGLSITSSWGNGHATNYRALVRELHERGHDVVFLERDVPWYASNRDLPNPPHGRTFLYASLDELRHRFEGEVRTADLVVVGSYVPDGCAVIDWVTATTEGVTAFYDIDTPVTLAKLAKADHEYLAPELIPRFDLYLSFTGGPTLDLLQDRYGAKHAAAFYCLVDPDLYFPEQVEPVVDLGYLGTYSDDRQPTLTRLLIDPAREAADLRFTVAGPQYPDDIEWPPNVRRIDHLPPAEHRRFYSEQRFTLNVTRADMVRAGWSPSVRLFEAAACGVPVISDRWEGLGEVFTLDSEILVADGADDVLHILRHTPDDARLAIGAAARKRVLTEHTAAHRIDQLLGLIGRGPEVPA